MSTDPVTKIASHVRDFLGPMLHAENYNFTVGTHSQTRKHLTRHPGLIEQLRLQAGTVGNAGGEGVRAKPASKPPVNLDAVAALEAISEGTYSWIRRSGRYVRDSSLESRVRAMVNIALIPDIDVDILARDVSSWRSRARILTGWAPEPYKPPVPCPVCEESQGPGKGLRVRFEQKTAACLSCGQSWDSETIALLGDYVRLTAEMRTTR